MKTEALPVFTLSGLPYIPGAIKTSRSSAAQVRSAIRLSSTHNRVPNKTHYPDKLIRYRKIARFS
ncbi:hypothetical protein [Duganella sp. HH105]|uniref:hypothetical protein n=1 Tax=Duganella sp. HH105 TaxID=1781067 RepID=UPI00114CC8F8|nr:hypothetical protein [Duganella sp. HH105]